MSLDDLDEVLKETRISRAKWYKIGLQLRVPVDKLDGIQCQFDNPEDHLCELLKEWLKGATGSTPTWRSIVKALSSQTVGEPKLADQLNAKHCQSQKKTQSKC